jgi:hypothetical protein
VTAVPYRYKFDDREIIAARPAEMVFAGFWLLFASLYCLLMGLEGIWDGALRLGLAGIAWPDVSTCLLGVLYFFVGRGLLGGRSWSRWVGVACGILIASLYSMYTYLLTGGLRRITRSYMLSLSVAIIVCWIATTVILLRRKNGAWFSLAERLRSEHKQQVSRG